ncbi:MAG TPA: SusE domain-containing protein, partial [Ferruginibacter sp.]|nr:SusE domain-containing protein [Ferruginibacter sp.]
AMLGLMLLAACKKYEFDNTVGGESISDFTLTAPATNTNLVLNAATPNDKVTITWNAAKPGVGSAVKYTWIAAPKTGSLDNPAVSIISDNNGASTTLTVTQKQLDDALKNAGIAAGAKTDLVWAVVAENSNNGKVRSTNTFNISVTRFGDGVTPFEIYGPLSSTNNVEINPTSTSDFILFKWQKATPANSANPVKYQLNFASENGSLSQPLFTINSGNNGTDTSLSVSWKQISDSLDKHGITDLSQVAKLKWNVRASSGSFSMFSKYENLIYILRKVSFYLVGSFTGWDINNPMEMVVDKRPDRYSKVFYSYVKLSAGDEFKFAKSKGDWNSAYGNTGGSGGIYTTGVNQGGNFQIAASGIYRLTIDLTNAAAPKAYIQQKQVGVVGNMQGWDPSAPIYGGYYGPNKFLIIANSNGTDEFKLHDGPVWDNSTADKARWWGIGSQPGLLDVDGNGANLKASTTPRTRVIWDGTDPQQLKYELSPADQMRIVGDAIDVAGVNQWDPGTSPQMTYIGNGKWQLTLKLFGNKEFKFLSGNAWGALDYEDAGGGKIKWDGGPNFKTPATGGTYTVTLDEHTGTYTIL